MRINIDVIISFFFQERQVFREHGIHCLTFGRQENRLLDAKRTVICRRKMFFGNIHARDHTPEFLVYFMRVLQPCCLPESPQPSHKNPEIHFFPFRYADSFDEFAIGQKINFLVLVFVIV